MAGELLKQQAETRKYCVCLDPDCGLPAEIETRWVWESSSGPIEMIKVRCGGGCWYTAPAAEVVMGHDDLISSSDDAGRTR
jgi:hypothetical protein